MIWYYCVCVWEIAQEKQSTIYIGEMVDRLQTKTDTYIYIVCINKEGISHANDAIKVKYKDQVRLMGP